MNCLSLSSSFREDSYTFSKMERIFAISSSVISFVWRVVSRSFLSSSRDFVVSNRFLRARTRVRVIPSWTHFFRTSKYSNTSRISSSSFSRLFLSRRSFSAESFPASNECRFSNSGIFDTKIAPIISGAMLFTKFSFQNHYPILPSISILMSTFISEAYSRGSSFTSGERKPFTTIVLAASVGIP